ncbi:hypothetical protein HID58_049062, partial [Brassica napus]
KDIFKGRSSSSKSLDEGSASGSRNIVRVKTQRKVGIVIAKSGRKVMIVVYTTSHSKNARQWALTNCIQDEDNITLFHVTKTSIGQDKTERNSRPHEQVHPLTNFCQLKKPKLNSKTLSTCKL